MTDHMEVAMKIADEWCPDYQNGLGGDIAAALAAAEERGRSEERERIVERLWAEHANEHTKLGVMLDDPHEDEVATNWQGGKVNGLVTAVQITKEPTP